MKIPDNIFDIACYYLMIAICALAVIMFVSQLFLTQSTLGKCLLGLMVIISIVGLSIGKKEAKNEQWNDKQNKSSKS